MTNRRLNVKHLIRLTISIVAVLSFIFVPYWISLIWFEPLVDPNIHSIYDDKVIILAWADGIAKIALSLVLLVGFILTLSLIYIIFDWLFPRTEESK